MRGAIDQTAKTPSTPRIHLGSTRSSTARINPSSAPDVAFHNRQVNGRAEELDLVSVESCEDKQATHERCEMVEGNAKAKQDCPARWDECDICDSQDECRRIPALLDQDSRAGENPAEGKGLHDIIIRPASRPSTL
jgi:hypothetical protein